LNISDHTDFSGSATDLATLAIACGQDFGLPVDPDKTNERLVRYYASEGIIDRPDRVGRDAAYGYRHLLQLLTARRMLQAGTALSVIGPHNSTATTKALEEGLAKPLPTAAELLVSSFLQSKRDGVQVSRVVSGSTPPASSTPGRPSKPAPPGPSIVDVLDEVRRIRDEWIAELSRIRDLQHEVGHLSSQVDRGIHLADHAVTQAESARREVDRHGAMLQAGMDRIAQLGSHLTRQNEDVLRKLHELLDRVPPKKTPRRRARALAKKRAETSSPESLPENHNRQGG
jgi:DNA-binding transcriptional MerR regulator